MKLPGDGIALRLAAVAFGAAVALSGCSSGLGGSAGSVQGKMLHTPETFKGTTTASLSGNGSMALTSSSGTECDGPYRQVPDDNTGETGGATRRQSGMALLTCSDGRTGRVKFDVGPDEAVGTGMLGRDIVTLTIGE